MELRGIHHVTLIVEDEERTAWFYEEVLGLKPKPRPSFRFPGLFYYCGNQEIHLIIASRALQKEDLFIRIDGESDITRRYIHRHAALLVTGLDALRGRLKNSGVTVLFDPSLAEANAGDELTANLVEGWQKMYGAVPIFCLDPSGNLLELVPADAGAHPPDPAQ
jgi:catechol 2,3-dioxygenase-like lactoylglutathione lyase family enzyme